MVAAGSITVAVRVRPPSSWEAARLPETVYDTTIRGDGALSTPARVTNSSCLRDIVQIVDDRILTFDPDEKDRARSFMERGFLPPGTKRYKDRRFMFDRVFGNEARQQEVYEATSQPLLKGLFEGYNATVFAYGATGCGKTHTISGTEADPGIIYLTMADLFQRIEDRKEDFEVEVMVTFLEIYNEEIRDLLSEPGSHAPRGGLSIREDKAVKVAGLVELKPRTAEEVKDIVILGNTRRTQSPTHANETSSRSHAVLQVHVTQSPRTAGLTEQRTMATLSIIDLAGSERAAATSNMGQRMVEGANINKSLLALGNCINALCESGGAVRHIPYRNSKLTRLLKFSLGGNCKTVMIVCVAPTSAHFDDTHNTLIYAERATKIKTKVVTRNVVNVDRHVGRYVEAINRLNIEIQELKDKLAGKRSGDQEIVTRKRAESKAEVERARKDLQAKMEHTQSSIVDGATCSGKLGVAKVKLAAIQVRLAHIGGEGQTRASTAEKALLQALAGPEEEVVKPGSALNVRLQRASNSNAMFDAMMKAVSERKSEKLDEAGLETVKLEASYRQAAIERLKATCERDAMREAVEDMADVMVKLVGMLGRCTVLVGEAANALNCPSSPDEDTPSMVKKVASSLDNMKEKNDEAFKALLGHSVESYIVQPNTDSSLFGNFGNYGANFGRRISSGPAVLQGGKIPTATRRNSTYNDLSISASPPRRTHRTPRKSLRSGLAPYRRAEEKKAPKPAKTVQWKDEAGQGKLDDRSDKSIVISSAGPSLQVTPASPATDPFLAEPTESPAPRCSSALGSESEWEDENEMTDDSVRVNFLSASLNGTASTRPPGRRARPSRLDPSFLKPKTRSSTLGSLREDEETSPERRPHPLSDRSLNRMGSNEDSTGSSEGGLHVPKARDRLLGSPNRRAPSTGKAALNSSTSSKPPSRRRSNIGPMRNEKGRRRSSMIPQLSPQLAEGREAAQGAARRVLMSSVSSPLKRPKRSSLTKLTTGSYRLKTGTSSTSSSLGVANLTAMFDANASADLSKGPRPTWR
ncbi:kinesin-like protein [Crepidotus variabilis]|uniref:Kinesin-like protein n=1 Tax=Crepidotus variabilis TaxID=179855 RepID=A0A9P6ET54_9AGAR|nr:kinesin-like protein [Crepidotus variabilis]